ncbi:MAG: tRNA (guanosine(46)-N7)-methyltransferase TrmB [Paludibacteraceae bacterium]|nr:tRNA (guanosine(46)-N7)-methyltransferase TrmB [Paludibacteraceae bacterium]
MGKNKLKKFAEMETFHNVFQCGARECVEDSPVVGMRGKWHAEYFHNDNPIVLELGCGRGEYTVGLAERNPNKNYIGIDIKGARMWAGAKQAELAGIKNVAFLRTNIEMISHFFAPDEVAEIWITFPDPQMKKATKRLTSTYFMARYRQLLQPNGIIHLKTDSPFLYTYTQAMVKENQYPLLVDTCDLYNGNRESGVGNPISGGESRESGVENRESNMDEAKALQTHYEHQWLDRGLTIKYIAWELPAEPLLIEPDIEIEKDTYRSYGRNYTSSL